jgi:hypothetical protein
MHESYIVYTDAQYASIYKFILFGFVNIYRMLKLLSGQSGDLEIASMSTVQLKGIYLPLKKGHLFVTGGRGS